MTSRAWCEKSTTTCECECCGTLSKDVRDLHQALEDERVRADHWFHAWLKSRQSLDFRRTSAGDGFAGTATDYPRLRTTAERLAQLRARRGLTRGVRAIKLREEA